MASLSELIARSVMIGVGATMVMDLWTIARKRLLGVASLDYRMVGRWIGHFRHGQFSHQRIADAAPMPGEVVIGWAAHYAIGVAFAGVLLVVFGLGWARAPSPGPALVVGLASVVAPFLVMQPALGSGFAASRTPDPNLARLRSLMTHAVFGLGLYVAGLAAAALAPME